MKTSETRKSMITVNALLLMLTFGISGLTAMAFDDDDTTAVDATQPQNPLDIIVPEKTVDQTAANRSVQTIRLGSEGLVPGRIAIPGTNGNPQVVNNVKIHFVKDGKAVAVVNAGVNGVFQAKGITPGEYAVVAAGPDVVAAYTVLIVAHDAAVSGPTDATLQLRSQGIPAQDFPVVNSMVNSLITSDYCSRFCNAPLTGPMVPTPEPAAAPPIPALIGDPEVSVQTDNGYQLVAFQDSVSETTSVAPYQSQTVAMQAGKVSGTIRWTKSVAPFQQPAATAQVAFIRNGVVHQIAQTDQNGRYEVTGLTPGSYSVFTACQSSQCTSPMGIQSGCAAFSIDCVENTAVNQYPAHVDSCLVGCPNIDYTLETMCGSMCGGSIVESAPIVDAGIPLDGYGGYGGMGYGGGGFVGGGGGGGGLFGGGVGNLLGLAGVGLGVAAIVDDDDAASPSGP